jgi:hypothetical protein
MAKMMNLSKKKEKAENEKKASELFIVDENDQSIHPNDIRYEDKMHLDFFSATFYSFRTHIKTEYRLLTSELSQYYFESVFIMMVQLLLCLAYLYT